MATSKSSLRLTPEEDDELCARAIQLATSGILPRVLKVAVELGLLDILVEAGPAAALTAEEITARLPVKNPPAAAAMVDRFLRLLAAHDIVACAAATGADDRPRKYQMAPICKFLTKNPEGTIGYLVLLQQDKVFVDLCHHLDSTLDGGNPAEVALGMPNYEYPGTDPRFRKVFHEAMQGHSTIIVNSLLRVYGGFDDVKVLVDVGGGVGTALGLITSRHPHIKGINFDLPHVISVAHSLPGAEHISGDMFESIPSGDAIFLKWILHNWSDEDSSKILKNCWRALPEKGKVIVVESILPEVPESTPKSQSIFQFDIVMCLANVGGRERTEEEFKGLANEAGFIAFKALPVLAGCWVMEFTK